MQPKIDIEQFLIETIRRVRPTHQHTQQTAPSGVAPSKVAEVAYKYFSPEEICAAIHRLIAHKQILILSTQNKYVNGHFSSALRVILDKYMIPPHYQFLEDGFECPADDLISESDRPQIRYVYTRTLVYVIEDGLPLSVKRIVGKARISPQQLAHEIARKVKIK